VIIEAAALTKSYNGRVVLNGLAHRFDSGLTYTIEGPNGCGKSTLLRLLALLEAPDAGEVRYMDDGGHAQPHDLALRRRLTLVLPHTGIFNTTAFNNVAYGLKIRGWKFYDLEKRVNDILVTVGLWHKRHQRALDLSSGETKRLGLARAMVIEPEVLLLDEPTANIDPANMEIIEGLIQRLKNRRNATILLITHDPAQARRLGDHCLVLKDGHLVPV
jgi:tungstate transport system ATP-binding protein